MEARELSLLQSRAAEKLVPSIFLDHGWPGAVVGSLTAAADEEWFDHSALLRWADDGGRWMGDSTVTEVRT